MTTSIKTYTINTAKGTHTGTLREVCGWQAEMQGSYARITVGDLEVDVDDIDFDGEDLDAAVTIVQRAIDAARAMA